MKLATVREVSSPRAATSALPSSTLATSISIGSRRRNRINTRGGRSSRPGITWPSRIRERGITRAPRRSAARSAETATTVDGHRFLADATMPNKNAGNPTDASTSPNGSAGTNTEIAISSGDASSPRSQGLRSMTRSRPEA